MTAAPARESARRTVGAGIADVVRIPAARRLQLADTVSGTGDALYWVALVVVLAGADSAGTVLAAAVVARLAPRLLFGPLAGVVVDRFDRPRLMMVLDSSRAVLMLCLAAVVALDGSPAAIVAIVFVVGALGTPYRPAATAQMASSVGEGLLAPANALALSVSQAVGLTGPLIAAALLAVAAPAWAFVANALTFVAAVALVRGARNASPASIRLAPPGRNGWGAALRSGLATVRRQDGLAVVLALAATLAVVRGAEMVLYVRVAEDTLSLGAGGYGLVAGAVGAGALVAIPLANRAARGATTSAAVLVAAVLSVVPVAVLAAVHAVVPALAVLAVQGAATAVFEVLGLTAIQRLCPPSSIGRVLGLHATCSGGTKLLGSVLAPIAVAAIGLRAGLVATSAVAMIGVLALAGSILSLGRRMRRRRSELAPTVDRLAGLGIFAGASLPSIERVAMHVSVEAVIAGTVVLREGAPADDFYVVAGGELDVDVGTRRINRMGPDDWFGEIGLLRRIPRTASVIATTDGVLWRIPGDEFVTALTAGTRLPDALTDDMEIRLARSGAAPD